jgi:hypothetical protein
MIEISGFLPIASAEYHPSDGSTKKSGGQDARHRKLLIVQAALL